MKFYSKGPVLTAEERAWYEKVNKGFVATGETIIETYTNGCIQTTVVFKGTYTPYGAIRDCGDHYIKALYSRFDRISKDFQRIDYDVNDM